MCEYLAKHASSSLRWAIAGRTRAKLEAVRSSASMFVVAVVCVSMCVWAAVTKPPTLPLCAEFPVTGERPEIGVIVASSEDAASLGHLAQQTRVVLSTVGPFTKYGEGLVAACVNSGTDYVRFLLLSFLCVLPVHGCMSSVTQHVRVFSTDLPPSLFSATSRAKSRGCAG